MHDRSKMVTAGRIGRVPVEAGAPRGQHDGVARVGPGAAAASTAASMLVAVVTGARPEKAAPTSPAASPMATTARTGGTVARRAARSSPLLRPPAINTTDEKPATAASTDAGVVALESSYHARRLADPTRLTRCGERRGGRQPVPASGRGVAPAGRGHGRGGQGIGQVVGQGAGQPGDRGSPLLRRDRPAGRRPRRYAAWPPDREGHPVDARRDLRRRGRDTTGSSALNTAVSPAPWLAQTRALAAA